MTQAEWLTCCFPPGMVEAVRNDTSIRKLRLFACACCRAVDDLRADPRYAAAIETAERFADGGATATELAEARTEARRASREAFRAAPNHPASYRLLAPGDAASPSAFDAAFTGSLDAGWPLSDEEWATHAPYRPLAELARCVFGDPFDAVAAEPGWFAPDVSRLAESLYSMRDWGRMPELANALATAGCADSRVLEHCRTATPHARGCWVVDAILGKW